MTKTKDPLGDAFSDFLESQGHQVVDVGTEFKRIFGEARTIPSPLAHTEKKMKKAGKTSQIMMLLYPDKMAEIMANNSMSLEYPDLMKEVVTEKEYDEMVRMAKVVYQIEQTARDKGYEEGAKNQLLLDSKAIDEAVEKEKKRILKEFTKAISFEFWWRSSFQDFQNLVKEILK